MKPGSFFGIILILFLLARPGMAQHSDWYERRSEELEAALLLPDPQEKIPALGAFMGIATNVKMSAEQAELFGKARQVLLTTPGHARYYQERIEAMRVEVRANEEKTPEDHREGDIGASDYDGYRSRALVALASLPSAETVAVLCHFAADPEGRGTWSESASDSPRPVNCLYAVESLFEIGIESPPVTEALSLNTRWQHVDAWKAWWDEVESGKRTYRFIGSPIEYGPGGPVAAAVVPAGSGPAKAPPAAPIAATQTISSGLFRGQILAVLGGLVLVIGGWLFLRNRRAR